MADKKINRRVQYTKNALRNALIDLAGEKPLQNITVTDICAKADINRSTFYLHYKDVRSLLREIEDDILTSMSKIMTPPHKEVLVDMMLKIKNNPRVIRLMRSLMGEEGDPQFVRRIEKQTYQFFQRSWEERLPHIDPKYKKLIYSYIVAGMVAATAAWINGTIPELDAEDVINLLEILREQGISMLPLSAESNKDVKNKKTV